MYIKWLQLYRILHAHTALRSRHTKRLSFRANPRDALFFYRSHNNSTCVTFRLCDFSLNILLPSQYEMCCDKDEMILIAHARIVCKKQGLSPIGITFGLMPVHSLKEGRYYDLQKTGRHPHRYTLVLPRI